MRQLVLLFALLLWAGLVASEEFATFTAWKDFLRSPKTFKDLDIDTRCDTFNEAVNAVVEEQFTSARSGKWASISTKSTASVLTKPPKPWVQYDADVPRTVRIALWGDSHGSVYSLVRALDTLKQNGDLGDDWKIKKADFRMVFMGDFTDRGPFPLENLYTALKLKLHNPSKVFLIRGNHESWRQNTKHGSTTRTQLEQLFGFSAGSNPSPARIDLVRLYSTLPVAVYMRAGQKKMQFCHGGLEPGWLPTKLLDSSTPIDFEFIDKYDSEAVFTKLEKHESTVAWSKLDSDLQKRLPKGDSARSNSGLQWNDFMQNIPPGHKDRRKWKYTVENVIAYKSGRGMILGKDFVKAYMKDSGLTHVFRAHQHSGIVLKELQKHKGFISFFDGLVSQVLSAPDGLSKFNYDNFVVLNIKPESEIKVQHCTAPWKKSEATTSTQTLTCTSPTPISGYRPLSDGGVSGASSEALSGASSEALSGASSEALSGASSEALSGASSEALSEASGDDDDSDQESDNDDDELSSACDACDEACPADACQLNDLCRVNSRKKCVPNLKNGIFPHAIGKPSGSDPKFPNIKEWARRQKQGGFHRLKKEFRYEMFNWAASELYAQALEQLEDKWAGVGNLDYDDIYSLPPKPIVQLGELPANARVAIWGDSHGSSVSLIRALYTLKQNKEIGDDWKILKDDFYMVFLGDYTDRGSRPIDTLYTVMRLKIANPKKVVMLRGNHESWGQNTKSNSPTLKQLKQDFEFVGGLRGLGMPINLLQVYAALPVAAFLERGDDVYQFCHGGIEPGYSPKKAMKKKSDFELITRLERSSAIRTFAKKHKNFPKSRREMGSKLRANLRNALFKKSGSFGFLWSDFAMHTPADHKDRRSWSDSVLGDAISYKSGRGFVFGEEFVKGFLNQIGVSRIFRAHQHYGWANQNLKSNKGFLSFYDGRVNQVLSAPTARLGFNFDNFVIIHFKDSDDHLEYQQCSRDYDKDETNTDILIDCSAPKKITDNVGTGTASSAATSGADGTASSAATSGADGTASSATSSGADGGGDEDDDETGNISDKHLAMLRDMIESVCDYCDPSCPIDECKSRENCVVGQNNKCKWNSKFPQLIENTAGLNRDDEADGQKPHKLMKFMMSI